MAGFKALVIRKSGDGQTAGLAELTDEDLMAGDVTVRVEHSTINYKDGLAITGTLPVVRRWPMVSGIDFAGTVEHSEHPDYRPGDRVVLTGWGVGETHFGGHAERARVSGDWLVRLPEGLTGRQAMAVGTAGFTAMLSVMALERHGVTPGGGPAVVTGASGGVGSVAVALLSKLGFQVTAVTGKGAEAAYLRALGAAEILDRAELSGAPRMLGKERWAAGIDNVGSHVLANLLSMIRAEGAVAACGNAAGMDLPGSVAPFILRGVSLLGINSVYQPKARREEAWARIVRDLDPGKLDEMTRTIGLDQVVAEATALVEGRGKGRVVVEIGG